VTKADRTGVLWRQLSDHLFFPDPLLTTQDLPKEQLSTASLTTAFPFSEGPFNSPRARKCSITYVRARIKALWASWRQHMNQPSRGEHEAVTGRGVLLHAYR